MWTKVLKIPSLKLNAKTQCKLLLLEARFLPFPQATNYSQVISKYPFQIGMPGASPKKTPFSVVTVANFILLQCFWWYGNSNCCFWSVLTFLSSLFRNRKLLVSASNLKIIGLLVHVQEVPFLWVLITKRIQSSTLVINLKNSDSARYRSILVPIRKRNKAKAIFSHQMPGKMDF